MPSANLCYDLTPKLKLRAAVARTLTRSDVSLLSPTLSVDANTSTMNARNPNLRPYVSNQIDLSLEYYFDRSGLLSVGAFYKDVDNFIVNTAAQTTQTVQLEEGGSRQQVFLLRQPRNGASSRIKGIELGAQVPFTFLPGPFDGLGVLGNFTYLDLGDVVVTEGQPAIPISGASTRSYNIAGHYEQSGFGIRASYNYRNGFVVDPVSTFGDGDVQRAYGQLDISASYDINRMITLNADITNATKFQDHQRYQCRPLARGGRQWPACDGRCPRAVLTVVSTRRVLPRKPHQASRGQIPSPFACSSAGKRQCCRRKARLGLKLVPNQAAIAVASARHDGKLAATSS